MKPSESLDQTACAADPGLGIYCLQMSLQGRLHVFYTEVVSVINIGVHALTSVMYVTAIVIMNAKVNKK